MKRILVVEDEQHIAFGIKYNLEAEGYDAEVYTVKGCPDSNVITGASVQPPVTCWAKRLPTPGMFHTASIESR